MAGCAWRGVHDSALSSRLRVNLPPCSSQEVHDGAVSCQQSDSLLSKRTMMLGASSMLLTASSSWVMTGGAKATAAPRPLAGIDDLVVYIPDAQKTPVRA